MDAFAKLFEDPQFYERVMKEMAEAMYLRFRNGKKRLTGLTCIFHTTLNLEL